MERSYTTNYIYNETSDNNSNQFKIKASRKNTSDIIKLTIKQQDEQKQILKLSVKEVEILKLILSSSLEDIENETEHRMNYV